MERISVSILARQAIVVSYCSRDASAITSATTLRGIDCHSRSIRGSVSPGAGSSSGPPSSHAGTGSYAYAMISSVPLTTYYGSVASTDVILRGTALL